MEAWPDFGHICFGAGNGNSTVYTRWQRIKVSPQVFKVPDEISEGDPIKAYLDLGVGVEVTIGEVDKPGKRPKKQKKQKKKD